MAKRKAKSKAQRKSPGEQSGRNAVAEEQPLHKLTAFFEDDVKGSIEPGKYADLVVLGRDILSVDPMEIKDIPILMTMTHGKFVYVNPNQDPMQKVDYLRPPVRNSYLD